VSASRKDGSSASPRKRRPATGGAGSRARSRPGQNSRPSRTGSARADSERSTAERILDAALVSFADRGYEATSLDALAAGLEVRKQTILYWFPSKERLLEAVVDRSAGELSRVLEEALAGAGPGFARVEAVVRSVFRLAARRPELLGLLREMGRLGSPVANRFIQAMDPLVQRATEFLEAEMDAGNMRRHEPRLLLLAIYSTVIGMVTEVEVLRALGEGPTARSLVRRRAEIIELLRSALLVGDRSTG
jgi:TetR/AcrR family transcriptional regulator